MTSMNPSYDEIRRVVAGFYNPTLLMEDTEAVEIIKARRDAMLLYAATMGYDDATEWNKLTYANNECYAWYNAGIRAARKLSEAQSRLEGAKEGHDGTEFADNNVTFLQRRVADCEVRLQDIRLSYRAALTVYELIAAGFAAAGHDFVETKWHTPEQRKQMERRKRATADLYRPQTPDTGSVFDATKYGRNAA